MGMGSADRDPEAWVQLKPGSLASEEGMEEVNSALSTVELVSE